MVTSSSPSLNKAVLGFGIFLVDSFLSISATLYILSHGIIAAIFFLSSFFISSDKVSNARAECFKQLLA
uniref:Uncharacterized protein n=1 Tax=Arundo donax TaxID=35708 RepID=A0A0A9A4H2_ARUDO